MIFLAGVGAPRNIEGKGGAVMGPSIRLPI
jgi:hypothetical protein